MSTKSEMLKH